MRSERRPAGPSPAEIKLRGEVDTLRRELARLKKAAAAGNAPEPGNAGESRDDAHGAAGAAGPGDGVASHGAPEAAAPGGNGAPGAGATAADDGAIAELTRTKQRLSRLYFSQVEENRRRQQRLHRLLEHVSALGAELDPDSLLQRIADTVREGLGYRRVLVRVLDPAAGVLRAAAAAGVPAAAEQRLRARDVRHEDLAGWMRDEFRVGRSYYIPHAHPVNRELPGEVADLGPREDWEWHAEDVLLVPIHDRRGALVACLSLDDPEDRLVPAREGIEMLEVLAQHAGVAIENARLVRELERHAAEVEAAGRRLQELHGLKSHFVGTVSQDLRTPLAAIRTYLDTLLAAREGDLSHDQARRYLAVLRDEGQRLSRLIESLFDLNRFDPGAARFERAPLDLAAVAGEAIEALRGPAESGQVALKLQIASADTGMEADHDQLRQLVIHLAGNAVKFTPPGGAVTVRLSGDVRDVMLEVEDSGVGIPEQELERIFERFQRVEAPGTPRWGGSGLGLALSRAIVEWHGGRIYADSVEGRGTRVTAVLPRRSGPRVVLREAGAGGAEVLRLALEMVSEVMNARVVSLLVPADGGGLAIEAAIGLDDAVVRGTPLPAGRGVSGWVARHRRPVCVSGAADAPGVERAGRAQYRTGTFLSVPLEGAQGLLGVLNVTDPVGGRPFAADDCDLLLHLAAAVAAAWEEARAGSAAAGGVAGTVRALRRVLDHLERGRRDAPDRVRLARALARHLRLPEAEAGLVGYAAALDGAVAAGAGAAEGSAAHAGPEAAEAIADGADTPLAAIESQGAVREIVLARHEWWDGTGYPRGLRGADIPAGGRILAVVDAWQDLVAGLTHRPAKPPPEALEELRRMQGRRFDPDVVDALEPAWAEVERERAAVSEVEHADADTRG